MYTDKVRFLFVVRHGQRKDMKPLEYPEYVGHPDAPLTPLGHEQAKESGVFIMKKLDELRKEYNVEPLVEIECSPFIRCMQTAAGISEVLGLKTC